MARPWRRSYWLWEVAWWREYNLHCVSKWLYRQADALWYDTWSKFCSQGDNFNGQCNCDKHHDQHCHRHHHDHHLTRNRHRLPPQDLWDWRQARDGAPVEEELWSFFIIFLMSFIAISYYLNNKNGLHVFISSMWLLYIDWCGCWLSLSTNTILSEVFVKRFW